MIRRPVHLTIADAAVDRIESGRGMDRSSALLVVAFAVVLAFLLYYAQYSGSVRWLLGVVGVSGFALFAWALIFRRTADPAPLLGPPLAETVRGGELGTLSAAVRRASRGLSYSQVLVASRARAAFLERARLALGISADAMTELQRNPADLHRIFGDPVLERFVRMDVGGLEERYRWVVEARSHGGFAAEFRDVLARMEAWR